MGPPIEKDNVKMLHVVGSPTNDYNFRLNLLYAGNCFPGPNFIFCFAVVFPDGRWAFPLSLQRDALKKVERVSLEVALSRITEWSPTVVHSHLMCVKGQTTYRGLLAALGFPMIGSSPTAYTLCKDKGLTRGVLDAHNMLAEGLIVQRWNQQLQIDSWVKSEYFPCVVKAADLDDSIGLSLVKDKDDLETAVGKCFAAGASSVIVEKFISGAELRVGVVEVGNEELKMLPVLHYEMQSDQIRSFEFKLALDEKGKLLGKSSSNISRFFDFSRHSNLEAKLKLLTFTAFRVLDLHDFALFDIRVDSNGVPWLLEIGLFCSFSEASILNIMAKEVGISPSELLLQASGNAIRRHQNQSLQS